MTEQWTNWAGRVACQPTRILRPRNAEELAADVARTTEQLRPVGSGHSFAPICHTDATMVDIGHLSGVLRVEGNHVTVGAGTPLRQLTTALAARGLALHNQGDIDHQTIAGAVSTSTHGTGRELGAVATAVRAITLCTPSGDLVRYAKGEHPEFDAACVSLGMLGIATEYTVECVPAYALRETTRIAPTDAALAGFEAGARAHRHFELFIFPQADRAIEKALDVTNEVGGITSHNNGLLDDLMLWGACALGRRMPLAAANVQRALLATVNGATRHGSAHLIYPSERRVKFDELEYAVPYDQGVACAREIVACLQTRFPNVAFPLELRTVAADDAWLSPFYDGPRMTISVHDRLDGQIDDLFAAVEPIFHAHGGRPHWGKRHGLTHQELRALYPRFDDFTALRRTLDPRGRMLSPYLAQLVGAP